MAIRFAELPKPTVKPWKRLRPEEVAEIRRLRAEGHSITGLAKRFDSSWATIRAAIEGTGAYGPSKMRRRATPMASGGQPTPIVQDFTDPKPAPPLVMVSADDAGPMASGGEAGPKAVPTLARLEEARKRVGAAGRIEMPTARHQFLIAQASHYEALYRQSEEARKEAKTSQSQAIAEARRAEAYRRWQAALRYVR